LHPKQEAKAEWLSIKNIKEQTSEVSFTASIDADFTCNDRKFGLLIKHLAMINLHIKQDDSRFSA